MSPQKINVKCGVENCQYNKSRMCHANSLNVDTMGDGYADTSDGTCCKTFKNND